MTQLDMFAALAPAPAPVPAPAAAAAPAPRKPRRPMTEGERRWASISRGMTIQGKRKAAAAVAKAAKKPRTATAPSWATRVGRANRAADLQALAQILNDMDEGNISTAVAGVDLHWLHKSGPRYLGPGCDKAWAWTSTHVLVSGDNGWTVEARADVDTLTQTPNTNA